MNGVGQRLLYRLRMLDEWQALIVCFVAGAATSLSFAPTNYWWILPFTISLFYFLLDSAAGRRHGLLRGFAFGYGFFIVGTWWIANALAVDAEKFGWLIPISIGGLSAVMALWFALFGWLVWWRRSGDAFADLMHFIIIWVVVEYLRTLGMFGFPWNLLGYAAMVSDRVAQLGAITGIYGLSLLVVACALLPVAWLKPNIGERNRMVYSAVTLIALIVVYGYGMARTPSQAELTDTRVRVVQGSIPQSLKWTPEGRLESIRIHGELSTMQTDAATPEIIIWEETALPFTLYPDSVWPSRVSGILPPRSTLITGAVRADDSGSAIKVWNSAVVIGPGGNWQTSYDKHQLVPFGEFVPLRSVLPIEKITPGNTDFSRGPGPQTLRVNGVPPFSPLVCYEVVFPWIASNKQDRPDWIVNVTNDAWYGDSPGPYQHFTMTRMRAIEQGLPLVRAANTGISAVIDPYGHPIRTLSLNQRGIIDQALPKPLPVTFYAQNGEATVLVILVVLWIGTIWRLRRRKT